MEATIARIAEHVVAHDVSEINLVLHGGEPLLAGVDFLVDLAARARAHILANVQVSLQTNGVLLNESAMSALADADIRVGVSLDGDAEATDRHRRHANGRSAYQATVRALEILRQDRFRRHYSGILCTIDLNNDPLRCYEALLTFEPPVIDFLLPHSTWSMPPPGRESGSLGTPYADWLQVIFDRWYDAPAWEVSIRMFTEMIQLLLGGAGAAEGLGLAPSTVITIDTDGSIKQLDSLSAAFEGAADTGLNVHSDSLDAALAHPLTIARQQGRSALSDACRRCQVVMVCGGGLFTHRYREGHGFANASVFCPDLFALINGVRTRIMADLRVITSSQ